MILVTSRPGHEQMRVPSIHNHMRECEILCQESVLSVTLHVICNLQQTLLFLSGVAMYVSVCVWLFC